MPAYFEQCISIDAVEFPNSKVFFYKVATETASVERIASDPLIYIFFQLARLIVLVLLILLPFSRLSQALPSPFDSRETSILQYT